MKTLSLLCFSILCCILTNAQKPVKITGNIISGNPTEIEFQYMNDNPISYLSDDYKGVFVNQTCTLQIPTKRLMNGQMQVGNYTQPVCFFPGDNIIIDIDGDSILFKGKGANKNNFLQAIEKSEFNSDYIYKALCSDDLNLDTFAYQVNRFIDGRTQLLYNYQKTYQLEEAFINYYLADIKYARYGAIESAKRFYCHKYKIDSDSVKWPQIYTEKYDLSLLNDHDTKYSIYNDYIASVVHEISEIIRIKDDKISKDDAKFIAINDSLSGKTRSYAMAAQIQSKLSESNYDQKFIDAFYKLNNDEIASYEVATAIKKYKTKQSLLGQPLHPEMANAIVVDSAGVKSTFGEMMTQFKGKVVYLDIWSPYCGPCRMAMPHSKKLKSKLANKPIEFVYITVDGNNDNLWDTLYEVSQTKDNHYLFENGFDSSLHNFMEIFWVPCYMIFDKDGKLANYSAPRPTEVKDGEESDLERELRSILNK
ncbi:TlpA family protein disulfide reductase [Saccharicrinis aurantiacus]|uniref:TlpA family protein disulfide reductase n=1 Tax=Saccharicrinis aurantiacus TaxID=1849719 RepID=UPI002492FD82|nr:TlpA disulfide reductase family protein [Saccharicrinis aurantiacus]